MKTNEMTPAWVVENFLPDYERKKREEYINNARVDLPCEEVDRRFVEYFFPEAIAELLKAQREVCAEVDMYVMYLDDYDNDGDICAAIRQNIRETKCPEPKNK
jgi:hypothetical protein